MASNELSEDLETSVRAKVLELLEKSYAGSRMFRHNHPDAIYKSNCHGALAYVFSLDDPLVEKPEIGGIVAFYENANSDDESLIHTALLVDACGRIFQQSGTGGIFEAKTIERQLRSLMPVSRDVEVKYYKFKS